MVAVGMMEASGWSRARQPAAAAAVGVVGVSDAVRRWRNFRKVMSVSPLPRGRALTSGGNRHEIPAGRSS